MSNLDPISTKVWSESLMREALREQSLQKRLAEMIEREWEALPPWKRRWWAFNSRCWRLGRRIKGAWLVLIGRADWDE